MNFIKNLVIFSFVALFVFCSVCYSQNPAITRDASGAYVYQTTISSLFERNIIEDIKIINNSSYPVAYIICKIVIKGKEHNMQPIPFLKIADKEGFDGYYEDDISKEIPKYFGKDGKFSRKNNNVVKFIFSFKENADKVAITDVYDTKDDLCFIISDLQDIQPVYNTPAVTAPAIAPSAPTVVPEAATAAPAVAPAAQQQNNGDDTVVIDGKKYLIHNGKAYPIQ